MVTRAGALMKLHLLRFSLLLLLLVPTTMKADIVGLGAKLNPVLGGENGSVFGFVTVDPVTFDLSATLFYSGLTGFIQQAGIFGPPDTLGNQVFGLSQVGGGPQDGTFSATGSLSGEDLANLLAGNDYFNVYTFIPQQAARAAALEQFVLGDPLAYRGQILPTPEPAAWLMLALCIGVVAWKTRRRLI